jgi:hypothetical protein
LIRWIAKLRKSVSNKVPADLSLRKSSFFGTSTGREKQRVNPWIETILAACLASLALYLGRRLSMRSRRTAICTCGFAILLVVFLLTGRFCLAMTDCPPLFALVVGRSKFLILALVIPLGLTAPLPHLPRKTERLLTSAIMAVLVFIFGLFPFFGPAAFARTLYDLPNTIDPCGVCLQNTPYTCGPAAAVTALNKLGIHATEGMLAVQARTCPFMGTTTFDLCRAINGAAAKSGLKAVFCRLNSLDQLPKNSGVLLLLKEGFMLTHCVALLDISDQTVTFADPAEGMICLPKKIFTSLWTGQAIIISPGV